MANIKAKADKENFIDIDTTSDSPKKSIDKILNEINK